MTTPLNCETLQFYARILPEVEPPLTDYWVQKNEV
jgi:hypothetical protein